MRDVSRLIVRSLIPVVKTTVFYNHATHVLHFTNGEIFDLRDSRLTFYKSFKNQFLKAYFANNSTYVSDSRINRSMIICYTKDF